MRREFIRQAEVCVLIILLFSVMNTLCRHWFFSSIAYCICGVIWLVHPVKMNDIRPEESQFKECRIAGVILFILGVMLRARFY